MTHASSGSAGQALHDERTDSYRRLADVYHQFLSEQSLSALLEKIARRNGLAKLSMGMSADFETAIGLGATHVRLGSAIFGDRPRPDG